MQEGIEEGKMKAEKKPQQMPEVVETVAGMVKEAAKKTKETAEAAKKTTEEVLFAMPTLRLDRRLRKQCRKGLKSQNRNCISQ